MMVVFRDALDFSPHKSHKVAKDTVIYQLIMARQIKEEDVSHILAEDAWHILRTGLGGIHEIWELEVLSNGWRTKGHFNGVLSCTYEMQITTYMDDEVESCFSLDTENVSGSLSPDLLISAYHWALTWYSDCKHAMSKARHKAQGGL
jgi:hypothetical protein